MIMQRLSLLARGTRLHAKIPVVGARFIPAGAGNTRLRSAVCISNSVYPRWRGEHRFYGNRPGCDRGLSPLARGTHDMTVTSENVPRFIPAGAGNTVQDSAPTETGAVYPRWRGEHVAGLSTDRIFFGLSPLARGTLPLRMAGMLLWRFIPAGAGNTAKRSASSGGDSVYPRWRGEHCCQSLSAIPSAGLSPLARGTQPVGNKKNWRPRFIPAGAGNTRNTRPKLFAVTVYPRWRGEHLFIAEAKLTGTGLSPLARGTPRSY